MSILFFQALMNGFMLAGLYSLIAAGVTLIFGVLHIVNFAQGAFLMLGSYMLYYMLTLFGFDFYTSLVLAVLIVGVLAILTERYLYHRFWLNGAVLPCLVVSIGLTQVMQNGALLVFGIREKSVDSVYSGVINIFGMRFSYERFMIIVFAYLIIVALMVFLKTSKRGQAMRAVAQDYDAARLLGINPKRIAMLGMFIGVGLSAVAGAIIAPVFSVNAYMGEFLMLKAFLVIVIGGLGSVPGAIYAAFLIGFVESFGLTYVGHITNVFLFVIVMLVLLVRPTGLFSGTVFQIR
jgi:branched-chain amino acid transport system permease protein